MTWGAWFLVFTLAGEAQAIGPFLHEQTCRAAIENAREVVRLDEWTMGWRLPPDARCERRT